MQAQHAGVYNHTYAEASRFYNTILGLEELYDFELEEDRAEHIFGLPYPFHVYVFGLKNFKIEVFVSDKCTLCQPSPLQHTGFIANDPEIILSRLQEAGIPLIPIERPNHTTWFFRDLCGNLFELKKG